jgi:hypothetical protein
LYIFTVSGRSYVVGENGVILADASQIDSYKKADLRHINDNAPLNVAVGKAVLLASDIAFMEQMYGELLSAGVEVGDAILPLGAGELHIRPKNETYIIKFSLTGEARQQVGAYLAVRDSGALAMKPQEYVDVRLAERVFVK